MAVDTRQFAAADKEAKEYSKPLSLWLPPEYKSVDINPRQGLLTAYLTVYKKPDGTDFVDPYQDVVRDGAFSKTINELNQARKSKNNPYLCADLWQHDRKEIIGGIKELATDSKGVIYVAQLNMDVQRARECFSLCEQKMIGSSYGYDPIRFEHKGDIRHLTEIRLHEVSQVTFPANDLADILETKDNKKFYVPNTYPSFPTIPEFPEEEMLSVKSVCGSTQLAIGPREEEWDWKKARQQYKEWGMDNDGNVAPDKWKIVHLFVDGNPQDATAYSYPYCYIRDGVPLICVDAVKQLIKSLKSSKTIETPAMRQKLAKILERINQKYARDPVTTDSPGMDFDYKQDFSTAWTAKQPGQLLQEFFRMTDTLSYVLLSNFEDQDINDKAGSVDTCCTQFSSAVKDWLPEYTTAKDAADAMSDGEDMPMMGGGMYGMYGLDMASISVKHVADLVRDEIDEKAGRTLSDKTKKKLRSALDNINQYLNELSDFVDGKTDEEPEPPKSADDTYDITQGLEHLGTLTPVRHTSSTSQEKTSNASISFPTLDGGQQEFNMEDLLQNIQFVMKREKQTGS